MFNFGRWFTSIRQVASPGEKSCMAASASSSERRRNQGAIDGACEFTGQMIPNLERAIEHPDMTEEFAEILSTKLVRLEYRVETDVRSTTSSAGLNVLSLFLLFLIHHHPLPKR